MVNEKKHLHTWDTVFMLDDTKVKQVCRMCQEERIRAKFRRPGQSKRVFGKQRPRAHHKHPKVIDAADFWSNVVSAPTGGCRLWTGKLNGQYGTYQGVAAHRIAFELQHGPLEAHEIVRHRCDVHGEEAPNRLCMAGSHLEAGSTADNMRDRREWLRKQRERRLALPEPDLEAEWSPKKPR